MAIITRASKGSALTHTEMDTNLNQIPNGANSAITDNGTNVGIGTSSPNKPLELGMLKAQRWQTGSTTLDLTPTAGGIDQFVFNTSQNALIDFKMGGTTKASITSGGITFNGDTSTANALDDYEEGTWIATLIGTSGGSVSGSVNSTYIKIGSMVMYNIRIENVSGASLVGNIRIGNLPFTFADVGGTGNGMLYNIDWPSDAKESMINWSNNTNYMNLGYKRDNQGTLDWPVDTGASIYIRTTFCAKVN